MYYIYMEYNLVHRRDGGKHFVAEEKFKFPIK
jgi:hypothetical protein